MHNCTRDEGGPFEVGNQVLTSKRTHADEIEMIFLSGTSLQVHQTAFTPARGSGYLAWGYPLFGQDERMPHEWTPDA